MRVCFRRLCDLVCSTEQWLELEVPPDAGNGAENAGLPLARLLWHLPPPALISLIEALLLVANLPSLAAYCHPSHPAPTPLHCRQCETSIECKACEISRLEQSSGV